MTASVDSSFKLSHRVQLISPSPTLAVTAKAKQLKTDGKDVISFAAGEPDFQTPVDVQQEIVRALHNGKTRYTPTSGTLELKQAVCQKLKRDNQLVVNPENVVISCGAKHSLYNLIQTLVDPGDEVLIPSPYWVSYPEMVRLAGGIPVFVETASTGFVPTVANIKKHLTAKTKLLILNSPSNPTGAIMSALLLKDIAAFIDSNNLFCISDEIYEYYVYDGKKHHSIVEFLKDWKSNAAVVNGVSKSHSMTGLRIGYTAAHPDIVKRMGMLQDHSTSNPTSIIQEGAVKALAAGADYISDLVEKFEHKRNILRDLIVSIDEFQLVVPEGAFYAFVDVSKTGLTAAQFSDALLNEKYVATIPGEGFGAPSHVRLSFATSVDDIQKGMRRIREWLLTRNN